MIKIILSLFAGIILSSCAAKSLVNTRWIYLKTTKGYDIFINKKIVKKNNIAKGILKYSWSKEKIKKAKISFEHTNMQAKKEFGYIPKGTEKLFNVMIKNHTHYYPVKADCKKNKIYIYQGIITITSTAKGNDNSDAGKMEKILCR